MKKSLAIISLISFIGAVSSAHAATWTSALQTAIQQGNFNQINIIAAQNPQSQGDIALYLLQQSQQDQGKTKIKLFLAAAPFVGQIGASDAGKADDLILAMLKIASDENFQNGDPKGAAAIFTAALIMSNQPNIVAADPNLHAAVLEEAHKFHEKHPGTDNNFDEQVSLAEAGGAPTFPPYGTINPRSRTFSSTSPDSPTPSAE